MNTSLASADTVTQTFLPNLFILGAAKCGTTTLYRYLVDQPDIFMTPAKEPQYFQAYYDRGIDWYHQMFFRSWSGQRIIGEAAVQNLYLPYVPKLIHDMNPDARLIVMVRNPIERAYSHWWFWAKAGKDTKNFPKAIELDHQRIQQGLRVETEEEKLAWQKDLKAEGFGIYRTYLDAGYYMQQINRYLQLFRREQLMVIVFDDLCDKPRQVVDDVLRFLNIDPATNTMTAVLHENRKESMPPAAIRYLLAANRIVTSRLGIRKWVSSLGIGPALRRVTGRSQTIDPATRNWLREHYQPHIQQLSAFLDRDFSHWN